MPCYVGLDASKKFTSICVMDRSGVVIREGVVPSTPEDIAAFLRGGRLRYARVGLEMWSMAAWLYVGLAKAGLPIICVNGVHAHGVLKARTHKTDRNDARGIADLMRTGTFKPVHIKSGASQEGQALSTARRLLKTKITDLENGIRGLLLSLGLKLDRGRANTFESRARKLSQRHEFATSLTVPLLEVRSSMLTQLGELEKRINALASADPVCRLLMTAPGVGSLTALIFRSCIDEPLRFHSSRSIGPYLGLVPRTYQSGEFERRGRISKAGAQDVRSSLFMAAMTLTQVTRRNCWLKTWGNQIAARRGRKKALVAVARRLAVMLHHMWVTNTPFRWDLQPA